MNKRKVFSVFDRPPSPSLRCDDASLTRQEFVQEADINNIMRKYASGLPAAPAGSRPPIFGDFSNVPSYQESLQIVIDAQERFAQLPSAVRKRFDNDPAMLLDFLADKANRDEAIKLGLIDKPVEKPVENPVSVPDDKSGAE